MDITEKKSFILYTSHYDSIKKLSDEQLGKLFRAIFENEKGQDPDLENEQAVEIAFDFIKFHLDINREKYAKKSKANRINGLKGGRPKGNPNEPKKPSGLNGNSNEPKQAGNGNGNGNGDVDVEENVDDIYKQVINDLNKKSGKNFLPTTRGIKKLIDARRNEGFTLDDFIKVNSNKSKQWKNSPEYNEYLRPQTLYGNKFESYLNKSTTVSRIKLTAPKAKYKYKSFLPIIREELRRITGDFHDKYKTPEEYWESLSPYLREDKKIISFFQKQVQHGCVSTPNSVEPKSTLRQ